MSRLLIRASAGSGKTFRLSGHFLHLLFLGNRPETILATTFTRKAAGEILGRVLLRLAVAAEDEKACQQLGTFLNLSEISRESALALLTSVVRDLHRMRVCTLDSFFQMAARSLTLELGLAPGWSIIDDHTDRELRQQAIDAVLSQHVSRDAQQLMQMLAKGRSKRSVRDLIDETVSEFYELFLLTDRAAWDQFPKHRRLTQEEREQAVRDLYASAMPPDKRAIAARAGDVERFQAGVWEAFVTTGLAARVFTGEPTYYGKPLSAELIEAYERLLHHAKAELMDTLAQQTRATWELISRFDREYSRLRSEHGWMRFSDVTRVLARSENAESDGQRMAFRLDSTIRHLLLDEFQDTSPDQWRILRRLALTLANRAGASSFFCVGDGKQAIYGWRGGESAVLDAVQQSIPEVQAESLDKSQRSSSVVIDTVNRLFQHLTDHQHLDDYQDACVMWRDAFPVHSTARENLPGHVIFRTSPEPDGTSAEDQKSPWHRWVAEYISSLHRQCPAARIGVLTRKNATVARLVHELTLLEVSASEEGGTPPTDSPAVLALMSLLHMASHPGCRISRFHVAGSPFAKVIDYREWQDETLAASAASRIRHRLSSDGYGQTLQWLSESVRDSCSLRDLMRLQQVVAAGWQFDESPSLNPSDFVKLLENSRFSKSEPAPVRVMTVHQSKGLEFDIVVLPELDTKLFRAPSAAAGGQGPGEPPDRVCIWRSRSLRALLPDSLKQAFDQTTSRDLSESMCLLYVALTRAVHSLHLLIPPVTAKKTPKTYAGLLLAALTDDHAAPPDKVLMESGDPLWFEQVPQLKSLSANSVQQPEVSIQGEQKSLPRIQLAAMHDGRRRGLPRRAPSRHEEAHLYLPAFDTIRTTPGSAADSEISPKVRGTLFHGWFEQIGWLAEDGHSWSQFGQTAQSSPEVLLKAAKKLAMPESVVNKMLPEFLEMLRRPGTIQLLSSTGAAEAPAFHSLKGDLQKKKVTLRVEVERPFVFQLDGSIVQGTIDRLVLAFSGKKVVAADILDFKTDRCFGDKQQWLNARRDHYAPQLAAYRTAVQHCFRLSPDKISARLLMVDVDAVLEV